jgi:hypothetical protein
MNFDLGCRLDYSITGPATLVFNIHAANALGQKILRENLQVSPQQSIDWHENIDNTRFFRVNPAPGPLSIEYSAQVKAATRFTMPRKCRKCRLLICRYSCCPTCIRRATARATDWCDWQRRSFKTRGADTRA